MLYCKQCYAPVNSTPPLPINCKFCPNKLEDVQERTGKEAIIVSRKHKKIKIISYLIPLFIIIPGFIISILVQWFNMNATVTFLVSKAPGCAYLIWLIMLIFLVKFKINLAIEMITWVGVSLFNIIFFWNALQDVKNNALNTPYYATAYLHICVIAFFINILFAIIARFSESFCIFFRVRLYSINKYENLFIFYLVIAAFTSSFIEVFIFS